MLGVLLALATLVYVRARLTLQAPGETAIPTAVCDPTPDSACLIPGASDSSTEAPTQDMAPARMATPTSTESLAEPSATTTATPIALPTLPLVEPTATPTPMPLALLAGPYLGQVTGSTVAISWVTRDAGTFVVRYGLPAGWLGQVATGSSSSPVGYWHTALLTGLAPGTTYRYMISPASGDATSPEMTVTTAPQDGTDHFTFVVLGDSRPGDRITAHPSKGALKLAAQVATESFSLLLDTGDMVAEGGVCSGELSGWEQYLRAYFGLYGDTLAWAPFYVTPGNHELNGSCGYEIYTTVFALPDNAPPGDEEKYYSFDWGNAHFTVLDTYAGLAVDGVQYKWLEHDLASTTQRWKFVSVHEPVYSSGDHGPTLAAQEAWVPLFEKYGVSVVFAGHDHIYERTCPILQGACTTPEQGGVLYFVSGGGGAALYDIEPEWYSLASRSVNHYLTVEVRGCALYFTATDGDGNVFDRYVLDKCESSAGG